MKIIIRILLLSILIPSSLKASSNELTIIGNAYGFKTGELLFGEEAELHTLQIENEKLKITISLKTNPQRITFYAIKLKKFLTVYAEPGVMNAEIYKKGFLKKTNFTGSASQEINYEFVDALKSGNQIKFQNLLSSHINTLPGIDYLERYKKKFSIEKVKELYSKIEEPFKDEAKEIKAYLDTYQVKAVKKGTKAYDFSWNNDKQIIKLSDFQDQYVLLNFTATGCKGCWLAYKELNLLQESYSEKIKVISFHIDNTKDAWYRIAERNNFDYKCTSLWQVNKKEEVLAVYKIKILPTFLLIDMNGTIINRWGGRLHLNRIIKEIN